LKADVRETAPLKRELEVTVEIAEVQAFINKLVDSFRKRYSFPGFRAGKVPANVVVGKFHEEIDRAVIEELVPQSIRQAMEEKNIHPAGPGNLSNLKYEPNKPLVITVEVEIWPEIELADYEGMAVDQAIEETTGDEVDAQLKWMQERLADQSPVERAVQSGDVVDIELQPVDGENNPLPDTNPEPATIEVGAENLLPEFNEAAIGAAAGDERTVTLTYPENFSNEELKGQTRHYQMAIKGVKEKKLLPLDDDLAQKIEPGLDLAGLKAKISLRLESEKRLSSRQRLEQTIVDRLLHENPFDLPETSVDMALKRLGEKAKEEGKEITPEELDKAYRPHVERAHRRELILARVGEREGVRVEKKDVEAEITQMAQSENRSEDEVRKDIGDMNRFSDFLFERRVFEALMGKLKIQEVKIPPPNADSQDQGK
jgi:trigger factor